MSDAILATVVIPMRNEEHFIVPCLESLLANAVSGPIEILVYDGQSDDRSAALVRELARDHPEIALIDNPARLQAAAFNLALARARGRFLIRADAHSLYPADYIAECIRLLESTGAANVGGLQRAVGGSWLTGAIAAAVSSRFAAGDAKYRHSTRPVFTDTVYLGAWRTATLRDVGGMREEWAVNEDYELNIRLRAAGGRVFFSPTISSTYFVRGSLAKLARQYWRYGFWKTRTLIEHPATLRWRQLAAPLLVLSLVLIWPLSRWIGVIAFAPVTIYAAATIVASVVVARRAGWSRILVLPAIFATIHFAWGCGFWIGLPWWSVRAATQRFNEMR